MTDLKVIISGGGTGGHIFPAISIANTIKKRYPQSEILFVGAKDRMEMKRVPAAGYRIVGLEISGLNRKNLFKNIPVMWKIGKGLLKARRIIKSFKPDVVIGVGGYASGPTLQIANMMGIPTVIQEQNSFAGVTNKWLAKRASKICVAYEHMEDFFPSNKIVITGTPCREDLSNPKLTKEEAYNYFELDPSKKIILVIGGSLGSRTMNHSIISQIERIEKSGVQIIWQCGELYFYNVNVALTNRAKNNCVRVMDFIDRMDLAYKAADLVISRAGAGSIAELSILGKPTILVPSPNVAEDHQTKNAEALTDKQAAILISDKDAPKILIDVALETINDAGFLKTLSNNIASFAKYNAADRIVDEIMEVVENR